MEKPCRLPKFSHVGSASGEDAINSKSALRQHLLGREVGVDRTVIGRVVNKRQLPGWSKRIYMFPGTFEYACCRI